MTHQSRQWAIALPLTLLTSSALFFLSPAVESIPRFSAEQGLACVDCHFAPGGGAMRNEFGHFTMSVNELTLQSSKKKLLESYKGPRLSEAVTVGADVRLRWQDDGSLTRYQADYYISTEPFYHTFFNFTFSSGAIDESYLLVERSDNTLWAQVGRFYPQYGLRLEDFSALVKQRTGIFHRKAVDGVSVGGDVYGHNVSLTYFSAGEQSVYLMTWNRYKWRHGVGYFAGISARFSEKLANGTHGANPALKGAYAGVGWRGVTLLFEGDLIGESNDAYAIYFGGAVRVILGLYGKVDYNFYDPDRRLQSGYEEFTRVSLEFWPMPFVEINPGLTFHTAGPLEGSEFYEVRLHLAY